MKLIDFDAQFARYAQEYIRAHKAEFKNMDEAEAQMPEIYLRWLNQAADWLETHAFLRQWAASSARFKPYENGPCRPERYPLFHIVSPGRLQAEGVSIEDLYDPIEAREGSLPISQGGVL